MAARDGKTKDGSNQCHGEVDGARRQLSLDRSQFPFGVAIAAGDGLSLKLRPEFEHARRVIAAHWLFHGLAEEA